MSRFKKYYELYRNAWLSFFHGLPINMLKRIDKFSFRSFLIIFMLSLVVNIFSFGKNILEAIYNSIALFAFNINIKTDEIQNVENGWVIYIVSFLASLYMILHIIKLLAKQLKNNQMIEVNKYKINYILVCGLGKKGTHYIDSELRKLHDESSASLWFRKSPNKHIIVIEKNPENLNIEKYRDKDVAVKIGTAIDVDLLKELHIENCKHIVLLAGKDTENIEVALAISSVLKNLKEAGKEITHKDTYMHIEDKDLYKFYKEGGLFDDSSLLHIKMFSLNLNSAKALFWEHDIDGKSREYIDSAKSFGIAVVGNTNLALEIIGHACEIAHFPNENMMTIYCVDNNIAAFSRLVNYRYPNIGKISTINLEFKKLNFQSRKFYEENFWKNDITNVMLCHDDAQVNLDIASELADSTYRKDIVNNTMETKIHIAIYENIKVAKAINENQDQFKYFDVFSETSKMASKEIIVDEEMETIAKCIHSAYAERYDPQQRFDDEEIETEWFRDIVQTDRDSNRAQAYHLPVKVKAMGLRIDKCNFNENCLDDNRRMFNLDKIGIYKERKEIRPIALDDDSLIEKTKDYIDISDPNNKDKKIQVSYKMAEKFDYFPDKIEILFEKLIRSEKNRWNAHHYLRGWNHSNVKKKELKEHDCLVPLLELPGSQQAVKLLLSKMKWKNLNRDIKLLDYSKYYRKTINKQYTVLYDIYSILYIPNFLTKIKWKLKLWK